MSVHFVEWGMQTRAFCLPLWLMITNLSILIPVFNDCAVPLVAELQKQASAIAGLDFEILIVDDGSTDEASISRNKSVERLDGCRYVRASHHASRSAMRNGIQQYARHEWRLMVDARLSVPRADFLLRYVQSGAEECARQGEAVAVCGGVMVDGGSQSAVLFRENLRFRYEKVEERNHSLACRCASPYQSLRTTNFFYHESVLRMVPYDERITGYGYEDVMLGRALEQKGVRILHIDNPVAYTSFEPNAVYLNKLREALCTLHEFSDELLDYSPLLRLVQKLKGWGMLPLVRLMYNLCGGMILKNLRGKRPRLFLLKLYKLGSYSTMKGNSQ